MMIKTFSVRITLKDGSVHFAEVTASNADDLKQKMDAIARTYPDYERSEGFLKYQREERDLSPQRDRRQADRRYTFAPGVIEGARPTQAFMDVDEWFPLSLAETLKLAGVLAVLGLAAVYLVERFA